MMTRVGRVAYTCIVDVTTEKMRFCLLVRAYVHEGSLSLPLNLPSARIRHYDN